ncbi:MAG: sulfatase-like hydrolase/transferase [Myxococcales bacterium]|nr:sulfatase-like hydrolase/transferase [Myxococcales bacterium]
MSSGPDAPPTSAGTTPSVAMRLTTLCLTAWGYAALSFGLLGKRTYEQILGLDLAPPSGDERWLIPLTIVGVSVSFMLPGFVTAAALFAVRRSRAALVCAALLGGLGAAAVTVDLAIYAEFGRHLSDVLRFLALPSGRVAGGDSGRWALKTALLTFGSIGLTALGLAGFGRLVLRALGGFTPGFRAATAALCVSVTLGVAVAPPVLAGAWRHSLLLERLFAALPFDLRRHDAAASQLSDPALAALEQALSDEYRTAFARLFVERQSDAKLAPGPRPNVIVIVIESWRYDALTPALMPRLSAWAARGLRLERHYAGSMYSEAGLFALLYGRSALEYHATLDQKLRPELNQLLARAGYSSGYFSGQPLSWMRQEEFVNASTFDRFAHDDHGDWVGWDRRALGSLVDAANTAPSPVFFLSFLMSSHFEYQYPKEYETHLPADTEVRFGTPMASLGEAAAVPLMNRYKNSMGFLDALIADSLDRLAADKNLIVVTGDHGESIFDDRRFGHGYSFAEIVARTPAFIVGPGVRPRRVETPTLHTDLLPTIGHVLGGPAAKPELFGGPLPELERFGGRDLLADRAPRTAQLLAHTAWDGNVADVLLISGNDRLRLELDLRKPRVRLKGFEDELGRLLPDRSANAELASRLRLDFAAELRSLSGG